MPSSAFGSLCRKKKVAKRAANKLDDEKQTMVAAIEVDGETTPKGCCWKHSCGSKDAKVQGWIRIRIVFAVLLGVVMLSMAISTVATPSWAVVEAEFDDYYEYNVQVTYGLWRRNRQGSVQHYDDDDDFDDDEELKKKHLSESGAWRAVGFNRATSILAVLVTFGYLIYYSVSACCCISPKTEVVLGALYIFFGLFAWCGSIAWSVEFQNEFDHEDYDEADDETPCGAGCALQVICGLLYVGLGIAMLIYALKAQCGNKNVCGGCCQNPCDCCDCAEDDDDDDDVEQPPPAKVYTAPTTTTSEEESKDNSRVARIIASGSRQ